MKYLTALLLLLTTESFAGAIVFKPHYEGDFPLAKNSSVQLTVKERFVGNLPVDAQITISNVTGPTDLKLTQVSRTPIEAIFELRETHSNTLVGRVVTSGDCHEVKIFILVLQSGVQINMQEAAISSVRSSQ